MTSPTNYTHEFVTSFPDRLESGILYVSVDFGSAAHRCFCGCGQEVYTRFSPRDWRMIYDGETVSLDPSIGNWSFACQSHYWLKRGRVSWAPQWSRDQVERGRAFDRERKAHYYSEQSLTPPAQMERPTRGLFAKLRAWFSGD